MAEFLTYELLTPETADPVVIRITGQKARCFPYFSASNGVGIASYDWPAYYYGNRRELTTRGKQDSADSTEIEIPASHWPAVKLAIRELNEHYKEKDMKDNRENISMKEDRYEFPASEWESKYYWASERFVLTRKKPRVKVEWLGA